MIRKPFKVVVRNGIWYRTPNVEILPTNQCNVYKTIARVNSDISIHTHHLHVDAVMEKPTLIVNEIPKQQLNLVQKLE
jgi:hypothetical protein